MFDRLQWEVAKLIFKGIAAAERLAYGVSLNLFDPKLKLDPYSPYSELREKRPIHFSSVTKAWWITRYDLAQELLKDKRFSLDIRKFPKIANKERKALIADPERLALLDGPSMLAVDPPDHTRIRRVAQQGFLHKTIQQLEPFIANLTLQLLPAEGDREPFDFIERLARPLPANVIGKMLGIPPTQFASLTRWSLDMAAGMWSGDWEVKQRGEQAHRHIIQAFRELLETRRLHPGDDLIDVLIRAETTDDRLTELELYNTCWLMLLAGHETTTKLLGNALYRFLSVEGLWQQLGRDRSLIPQAIEEVLRYEPPVHAVLRYVLEDMNFHGAKFKKGDTVYISIAGTNRDPAANPNPDHFDIHRGKIKHLAFGTGIHMCFGASLARLQAKAVFDQLLNRYPNMRHAGGEVEWGDNPVFRGLNSLLIDPGASRRVNRHNLDRVTA